MYNKYFLPIFVGVALTLGFVISQSGHVPTKSATQVTAVATSTSNAATAVLPAQTPVKVAPVLAPVQQEETATAPTASNITLKVGEKTYGTYIEKSDNVLNIMRTLASTTDLTFSGYEYPSMGMFVDSINGERNTGGTSWFLYINGSSSQVGASSAIVKSGDAIEWKYEKNY